MKVNLEEETNTRAETSGGSVSSRRPQHARAPLRRQPAAALPERLLYARPRDSALGPRLCGGDGVRTHASEYPC